MLQKLLGVEIVSIMTKNITNVNFIPKNPTNTAQALSLICKKMIFVVMVKGENNDNG